MITFDNSANSGAITSGVSSTSFNITIGTGSNRGALVSIHTANQSVTVNSVTLGGTSMSSVVSRADSIVDAVSLYYLRSSATGSQSVSVTLSGTVAFLLVGAATFFGVDQATATSGVEATASAIGTSATAQVSLTTLSNGAYYFASMMDDPTGASGAATKTDGQTETYNIQNAGGTDADGYKGGFTPNAAHTIGWSLASTGPEWVIAAVSLKPALTGAPLISMMGVGA